MAIYKTTNLVETYRYKAKARDINELTGRTGRPDLTNFVAEQIKKNIKIEKGDIIVDVGCGDGTLLKKIALPGFDENSVRLIGILPSKEEVKRVRKNLGWIKSTHGILITIYCGRAEETGLRDSFCDQIICNSVLHGSGQTFENVNLALEEFSRILKERGRLYIGEIPDSDELSGKQYGDSLAEWLKYLLKNEGFVSFFSGLRKILLCLFTDEPFIITPKYMFFIKPKKFEMLLKTHGFNLLEKSKHLEIDKNGKFVESKTRWNYQAIKIGN